LMSGKVGLGTPGYFIAADESGGASYDKEYCLSFKDEGIDYKMAKGCLAKKIMMLEGASSTDDVYDTDKYVDAMTKNHDTNYDSFYEINIPLKTLGIDKKYLEENGIGVMQIATRGQSGIDCIPHDPCMLDNALGECAVDPSTSHEKDDEDIITVPLAAVGSTKAIGNGGGGEPLDWSKITTATTAPTATEKASDTEATTAPTSTSTTQTAAPTSDSAVISEPTDQFVVNFGADKAAPQAAGSNLTLKAIPYNADGECTYEFSVDGEVVQEYSDSDTYNWTAATGTQKIAVSVKDAKGNVVTVEKDYTTEGEAPEVTTAPTNAPTATPAAQKNDISVSLVFSKKNKCAVNTKISIRPVVNDYVDSYTYTITARKINGSTKVITRNSSSKSVSWKPTATGKYELFVTVIDKNNNVATASYSYKVTLISLKLKASAKTVKLGKKVKITAKASNINGKAKYQYVIKKGSKKIKTVKYSSKKAYTWTVSKKLKKGTYSVIVSVKDNSKKVVKKTVKIKVK